MEKKYVLSMDVGTQSIRGIIFDQKGNIQAKEKKDYAPYFSKMPGFAEQNADFYWQIICEICQNLKEKNNELFNHIMGMTLTTMRNTVVMVDHNGKPLRPAILWLDQRMAKEEGALPTVYKLGTKIIGAEDKLSNFRKAFRWQWVRENEKHIIDKTYKYLMISAYLNFKLTDKFVDSSASQLGYIPFDFKRRKWASKYDIKSIVFNIEKEKMPELAEPGQIIGFVTNHASQQTGLKQGMPIIASGSDKGCETIGTGCLDSHIGNISLGSAVTIQTMAPKYIEIHPFMPSYPALISGMYNPEIQINRGYWMIRWFKNQFAEKEIQLSQKRNIPVEILLDELLESVPPGSDGLFLQPYWGGELKDPFAKGAVIGFTDEHTRAHLYRAIVEGINYAVLNGIEAIEKKTGHKMEQLAISGGGAQSQNICQITADMVNRPVYCVQTYETSGLGAAVSCFTALGIYKNTEEAVRKMIRKERIFTPNPSNTKKYQKLYQIYKKIYPNLKRIYKEIDTIVREEL